MKLVWVSRQRKSRHQGKRSSQRQKYRKDLPFEAFWRILVHGWKQKSVKSVKNYSNNNAILVASVSKRDLQVQMN